MVQYFQKTTNLLYLMKKNNTNVNKIISDYLDISER